MSSIPIPLPDQAARLRVEYRDNPVIQAACDALTTFAGDLITVDTVSQLLPMWARFRELSVREVMATLAMFADQLTDPYESYEIRQAIAAGTLPVPVNGAEQ